MTFLSWFRPRRRRPAVWLMLLLVLLLAWWLGVRGGGALLQPQPSAGAAGEPPRGAGGAGAGTETTAAPRTGPAPARGEAVSTPGPGPSSSSDPAGSAVHPSPGPAAPLATDQPESPVVPAGHSGGTAGGAAENPGDPDAVRRGRQIRAQILDRLPACVAALQRADDTSELAAAWRAAAQLAADLPLSPADQLALDGARAVALDAAEGRTVDLLELAGDGRVLAQLDAWRVLAALTEPGLVAARDRLLQARGLPVPTPTSPAAAEAVAVPAWRPGRALRVLWRDRLRRGVLLGGLTDARVAVRLRQDGGGVVAPAVPVADVEPVDATATEALAMAAWWQRRIDGSGPALAWLHAARVAGADPGEWRAVAERWSR